MKNLLLLPLLVLPLLANGESKNIYETGDATIKIVEHNDTSDYYVTLHKNAPHIVNMKDVPRFTLLGKEAKFIWHWRQYKGCGKL